jgi:hypothetical protein
MRRAGEASVLATYMPALPAAFVDIEDPTELRLMDLSVTEMGD